MVDGKITWRHPDNLEVVFSVYGDHAASSEKLIRIHDPDGMGDITLDGKHLWFLRRVLEEACVIADAME